MKEMREFGRQGAFAREDRQVRERVVANATNSKRAHASENEDERDGVRRLERVQGWREGERSRCGVPLFSLFFSAGKPGP